MTRQVLAAPQHQWAAAAVAAAAAAAVTAAVAEAAADAAAGTAAAAPHHGTHVVQVSASTELASTICNLVCTVMHYLSMCTVVF